MAGLRVKILIHLCRFSIQRKLLGSGRRSTREFWVHKRSDVLFLNLYCQCNRKTSTNHLKVCLVAVLSEREVQNLAHRKKRPEWMGNKCYVSINYSNTRRLFQLEGWGQTPACCRQWSHPCRMLGAVRIWYALNDFSRAPYRHSGPSMRSWLQNWYQY